VESDEDRDDFSEEVEVIASVDKDIQSRPKTDGEGEEDEGK
jgi:hypothetical protein